MNLANSAGWTWIGPTSNASTVPAAARLYAARPNSTATVSTYSVRACCLSHS